MKLHEPKPSGLMANPAFANVVNNYHWHIEQKLSTNTYPLNQVKNSLFNQANVSMGTAGVAGVQNKSS